MRPRRTPLVHSAGPGLRIVVHVTNERSLHPDLGAGVPDAPDRLARHPRLELNRVRVVSHDRQMAAGCGHFLEQLETIVGIVVRDKALWPVGKRLCTDPNILNVLKLGREQRLNVPAQHFRAHDHRIAARDQDVCHLGMRSQIRNEVVGLLRLELQTVEADKLSPSKTVGAIRMTGLPRRWEEQHGLAVFVLQPGQRSSVKCRHVVGHLTGRVRIELSPDAIDYVVELRAAGASALQITNGGEVGRREHPTLRKDQLKDRVVRNPRPIDQAVQHVLICSER